MTAFRREKISRHRKDPRGSPGCPPDSIGYPPKYPHYVDNFCIYSLILLMISFTALCTSASVLMRKRPCHRHRSPWNDPSGPTFADFLLVKSVQVLKRYRTTCRERRFPGFSFAVDIVFGDVIIFADAADHQRA